MNIDTGSINRKPITNRKSALYYLKRDYILYLLLLFPLAYVLIFKYGPMYGVLMAFQDYNISAGILGSQWVGFDVFNYIFHLSDFYKALRNTLLLNALDLVASFPVPVILAILLNELRNEKYKKISQTVLYLPHFLSWVIIGGMVYLMFSTNGMVNQVLALFGIEPVAFLTTTGYWLFVYVISGVWQSAGWGTIIYLAAITGINKELYEAADIDGAGRMGKIWHVTLPGMKPTILILLILQLGRMVAIGFDRPFNIGNSLVKDYSDVISTFVYRVGLGAGDFAQATAVGLFQSVVSLIFLLLANYIVEKNGEQGIW